MSYNTSRLDELIEDYKYSLSKYPDDEFYQEELLRLEEIKVADHSQSIAKINELAHTLNDMFIENNFKDLIRLDIINPTNCPDFFETAERLGWSTSSLDC